MNKFTVDSKKMFWGLVFIFAAAAVIISPMAENTGVWDFIWTIIATLMLFKGIVHFSPFKMIFSIAILGIVYAEQLGIEQLTPWLILIAALLLSIGLSILFKRNTIFKVYTHNDFYRYAKHHHQDSEIEIEMDEKND